MIKKCKWMIIMCAIRFIFSFQAQTFSDKNILDVILYMRKHVVKFTSNLALNFKFII